MTAATEIAEAQRLGCPSWCTEHEVTTYTDHGAAEFSQRSGIEVEGGVGVVIHGHALTADWWIEQTTVVATGESGPAVVETWDKTMTPTEARALARMILAAAEMAEGNVK